MVPAGMTAGPTGQSPASCQRMLILLAGDAPDPLYIRAGAKVRLLFPRFFPPGGTGLTSLRVPLFDVGRAVATKISRSTFPIAAQPVELRDNDRGDLLGLAQLASAHMRTTISANTISQLIEIPARSQVPMMPVPNSVPKLSRSGAPRRAGMKFQINADRCSGAVAECFRLL
jgi:hypothetical protein